MANSVPDRSRPSWLYRTFLGRGTTNTVIFRRMIPIAVLLLLTVNPWGLSYYHWVRSWVVFMVTQITSLPKDDLLLFAAAQFVLIACGLTLVHLFLSPFCRWSGLSAGRFVTYRLLPLVVIPAIGYFWLWDQFWYWNDRLFSTMALIDHVQFAGMLFVGLCFIAGWVYVFSKAWHGLGSRRWKAGLAGAVFVALLFLLYQMGLFPSTLRHIVGFVEILFGLGLGFCFSLYFVDWKLSRTAGTSAVIADFEGHELHGHDHDQDPGEDFHDVAHDHDGDAR